MNNAIIVFDLDDTLYPEVTYVESGFLAVARFLEQAQGLPCDETLRIMNRLLESNGRGKVFNDLLRVVGVRGVPVSRLVSIYRQHAPLLNFFPGVEQVLTGARRLTSGVYVLTDGNRLVQRRKAEALKLSTYVDRVYFSRDYGIHNEKPSTFVLERIARAHRSSLGEVIYVGDDPSKDFLGVLQGGGQAVRVLQGRFASQPSSEKYPPQYEIPDISNLSEVLLQSLIQR